MRPHLPDKEEVCRLIFHFLVGGLNSLLVTKNSHLKTKFGSKTLLPISDPRKCKSSVLSEGASCTKSLSRLAQATGWIIAAQSFERMGAKSFLF